MSNIMRKHVYVISEQQRHNRSVFASSQVSPDSCLACRFESYLIANLPRWAFLWHGSYNVSTGIQCRKDTFFSTWEALKEPLSKKVNPLISLYFQNVALCQTFKHQFNHFFQRASLKALYFQSLLGTYIPVFYASSPHSYRRLDWNKLHLLAMSNQKCATANFSKAPSTTASLSHTVKFSWNYSPFSFV